MPHVYWKTIFLVGTVTTLMAARLIQVLLMFSFNFGAGNNLIVVPGSALDISIVVLWVAILLNEKMGERWGLTSYVLLALRFIAVCYVRLVLL